MSSYITRFWTSLKNKIQSQSRRTQASLLLLFSASAVLLFQLFTSIRSKKMIEAKVEQHDIPQQQPVKKDTKAKELRNISGMRVCCSTIGVVLNKSPDESSLSLDESSAPALLTLLKANELYLINIIDEPQQRYEVMRLLEETGMFYAGLSPENVLFCSNHAEKMKTVMELSTSMYIDADETAIYELQPHVSQLVHVTTSSTPQMDGNVAVVPNIAHFLLNLNLQCK